MLIQCSGGPTPTRKLPNERTVITVVCPTFCILCGCRVGNDDDNFHGDRDRGHDDNDHDDDDQNNDDHDHNNH